MSCDGRPLVAAGAVANTTVTSSSLIPPPTECTTRDITSLRPQDLLIRRLNKDCLPGEVLREFGVSWGSGGSTTSSTGTLEQVGGARTLKKLNMTGGRVYVIQVLTEEEASMWTPGELRV